MFDISNSKMEIDNTCSLMCHLSPEYHGMAVKQTKIHEADPWKEGYLCLMSSGHFSDQNGYNSIRLRNISQGVTVFTNFVNTL